ncbi:hypothetical protein M440DRAFT_246500 [Trichoderma longibrachiatum ATCC 18648]|uniref:Uncharacterized protein n=1 Tax=Trichoderma longibrachiatum ATCC 18648 TaxID=983965 RepID=A0A2T4CDS0_TRILO|nr:hypothetical protein M440DRAFT_246500 [Trichoderma longibrachiatum ATCC 18648]
MNKDEQTSPVVVVYCLPSLLLPSTADKAADSLVIHSELPNNASRPFLSRIVVCFVSSFVLSDQIHSRKDLSSFASSRPYLVPQGFHSNKNIKPTRAPVKAFIHRHCHNQPDPPAAAKDSTEHQNQPIMFLNRENHAGDVNDDEGPTSYSGDCRGVRADLVPARAPPVTSTRKKIWLSREWPGSLSDCVCVCVCVCVCFCGIGLPA